MVSKASGSLTAIRALFLLDRGARADAARRFLSSWAAVRLGAVSLMLGGGVALAAAGLQAYDLVSSVSYYSPTNERLFVLIAILCVAYALLLPVGLLGLYAARTKRRRWVGGLAAAGVLVAALAGAGFCAGALYEYLAQPAYYGSPGVLRLLFFAGLFGQPAGAVLVGIAALPTRSLGPWRPLPLAVGLLGSPLTYWLLASLLLSGDGLDALVSERTAIIQAVLVAVPGAFAGLGWSAVGLTLLGARGWETALLAKDRRATEEGNGRKARDLYERAFGAGDLSVVDEIAALDLLDRRSGGRGPDAFRRTILGVRRAFPDLRFSVEGQTADGDTVTTRCSLSGTDKGGFLWYPPTGKGATFAVAYVDRFRDGKLVEHDAETDTEALLVQLGLLRGDR